MTLLVDLYYQSMYRTQLCSFYTVELLFLQFVCVCPPVCVPHGHFCLLHKWLIQSHCIIHRKHYQC